LTAPAPRLAESITQDPLKQPPPEPLPNQSDDFKSAGQQSTDFWGVMLDGFAIPPLAMSSVTALSNLYASNPDFLTRSLQRSAPYMHEIIIALKQRGMPTELALLPVIESGFDPGALSPASAAGIWQFIPGTGRRFGLKQDWLRDERRDPLAATSAALDYLQTLYGLFKDWHLALAAYNCGENCVSRAIQRSQFINGGRDFASIARFLPQETRDYVPRFIAVRNVFSRIHSNGVRLPRIQNSARITSIFVNQPVDLASVARLSGISYEELATLNAGVLRQAVPAVSSLIWLPETALAHLKESIANASKKNEAVLLMSLKPVRAALGESLKAFANRQAITIDRLRAINNIPASLSTIQSGTLFVPKQADDAIFRGDILALAPLRMVGEERLRKALENKTDKLLASHPQLAKSSGWIPGRLRLGGRSKSRRK
jgi:membrane-bound lytic murein transglycosylase D